jgi:methionine synthase II (cobalamin-independent)
MGRGKRQEANMNWIVWQFQTSNEKFKENTEANYYICRINTKKFKFSELFFKF